MWIWFSSSEPSSRMRVVRGASPADVLQRRFGSLHHNIYTCSIKKKNLPIGGALYNRRRGDGDVEPSRRKPKIRRCDPPPATRAPYLLRGSNCRGIPSATAQIQPRTAPIREWRSFSPRPGSCVRFAASLCKEPVAPAFPLAVTSLPFRSSKCPHN